ncbi:MAG: hypothetical protein RL127_1681 [Bacteroidota bacterium]
MKFLYTFFVFVLITSCTKEVDLVVDQPYVPSNLDVSAGAWKTFILASSADVVVAAPKLVSDAAYLKEVDSLKTVVIPSLTSTQKSAIQYWGAGAVLRWNEIARELAARYNQAPAANAAGVYPVPNAADPLADPRFPFANPPYTARALAYLSVAQYDALVSAWKYKYQYNRKAPYVVDASIKPLLPVTSEDAVVAQASYVILLALFPGEGPFLAEKLAEAKNARLWAGMNVGSDVSAGASLGAAVAAKVMARAKADGMSASNDQSIVPNLIAHSKSLGFVNPWASQEIPARPPMLPNYGAVKTWNFDRATMESIRPAIPYLEGSAEFKKDLAELEEINKNQTRNQAAIANYWADGPGSYTPSICMCSWRGS